MNKSLERVQLLVGEEGIQELQNATVLVVGIGGVGSHAAEALARAGIGHLLLLDGDVIQESNLNRQIHATVDTIGQAKVEAMKNRIHSIQPNCKITTYQLFFDGNQEFIFDQKIDYVVDAIDTISSKLDLIQICQKKGIPFISSLGMANRWDSSQLIITTLDKTNYDPFAKAVRSMARKRAMDLRKIPVIFSKEVSVVQNKVINVDGQTRKERIPPASTSFVPPAAGLLAASYVTRKLLEKILERGIQK